jgi:hypothetical protein
MDETHRQRCSGAGPRGGVATEGNNNHNDDNDDHDDDDRGARIAV